MINKRTRLKIMAQMLTMTSVLSMGIGYNLVFNEPVQVNAYTDAEPTISETNLKLSNDIGIQQLSVGGYATIILKDDGTAWGSGFIGFSTSPTKQTFIMSDVKKVYHFKNTSFFIKNDGTVWGLGDNTGGIMGIGNTTASITTPTQLPITNIENIDYTYNGNALAFYFSKSDGTVWACGSNYNGALGIGNTITQTSPVQIMTASKIFGGINTSVVSYGSQYFLKDDGTVYSTGYNRVGQLGTGSTADVVSTPVKVLIDNVKDISAYYGASGCAYFLKNDGTVWATGYNYYGQLGIGNTTNQVKPVQVPVSNVEKIITDGNNTYFLKNDGTVFACGRNNSGQLGIGTTTSVNTPVQLAITDVKDCIVLSNNMGGVMFLKNDGTVFACGRNFNGQLGLGTTESFNSLTQIPVTNIKSICAGEGFSKSFFITNDGDVWATGANAEGDFGIGTKTTIYTPVKVPISNVNSVIYSYSNGTYYIKDDGTILGAGLNSQGQFGIGNKTAQATLVNLTSYWLNATDIATTAVAKAEGSKLQVDVDSAQILVTALTDITAKDSLQARLNTVQAYINNIIDATNKVLIAETTKTQTDVDTAQIAIYKLTDGTDKTNLQTRLDKVKADLAIQINVLAEATNAVIKAEGSKNQTDVDSARILVNALPDNTSKTTLIQRLDAVQAEIDKTKQDALNAQLLSDANAKVTTAESTKTQADIDIAQTAIDKLATGTDKTDLQNRLDKVKSDLVLDDSKLTNAIDAVVKAEGSKTQADVDSAKVLVNALPDGTAKMDLTNRLDIVQAEIDKAKQDAQLLADAQAKVTNAESTKSQTDIDTAQTAIDKLATGTDRTDLQNRLDKVKSDLVLDDDKLTEATDAVVKAETSKLQADVDSAKILVVALLDGTTKTDLTNRLNVVQAEIDKAKQDALNAELLADAQAKLTTVETTKTQADIDIAQIAINKLATGADKATLQTRLDKVKSDLLLDEAKKTVEKAETTKTPEDISIAKKTVNELPDGTVKIDLTNQLKEIQDAIDKANQDALNAQLLTDAKAKLTTAESTKSQTDVNIAQTAINKLPNGTDKTDLQARLDVIKKEIADKQTEDAKQAVINNATALVTTAESTKSDIDILRAQTAVNTLPVGTDRTTLQNRLDAIKQQIAKDEALATSIKEATEKVRWAEAYVTNSKANDYIATAQSVIDNLPSSADKTALQERINKVKAQIANTANATFASQANILVKQAELMKKNPYFTKAWAVVNKMTTCDAKTNFMNRLKALGSDMEIK